MTANIENVSGKEFDYIIVGGGTAGLTLATRLSEDPDTTILVLEAGEANLNDDVILFSGQALKQMGNPKYDWSFKTVNQVHSGNRSYMWPRGKGLGGSSAINLHMWNKPAREHLDAFRELGNEGWSWERFKKYSKRGERFVPPDHDQDVLTFDMAHRGDSGCLPIAFPNVISNMERPFLQAMEKHGVHHIPELSSGNINGTSVVAISVDPKTHYRSYAANMYYQPVADRKNLTILATAHVTGLNTLPNGNGTITAAGVKFLYHGEQHEAKFGKEVCLCAGAIMSPQILELSGIGDPQVLERAGIDVKIDLPGVGANVQEHVFSTVAYKLTADSVDGYELFTHNPLLHSAERGSSNLSAVSFTFLPLDTISSESAQIHEALAEKIRAGIAVGKYSKGLQKQYQLQLEQLKQKVPSLEIVLAPGLLAVPAVLNPGKTHASICLGMNTPFSRGTIHVESKDPLAYPVIDPHIFEESYDLTSMVELMKFSRKLAKTEPFSEILGDEVLPGSDVETDEDWFRKSGAIPTAFHSVGSCSMLPLEDGGVVDPRLKVYHTTNVRVVDLSIVPLHVGCHTQSIAYGLGEQAADIIKGLI